MYDTFVSGLHDGTELSDVFFELFECDNEGNVIVKEYLVAYVIVDNGYLDWLVTVPPFSRPNSLCKILPVPSL
jgi:hypothetical protein